MPFHPFPSLFSLSPSLLLLLLLLRLLFRHRSLRSCVFARCLGDGGVQRLELSGPVGVGSGARVLLLKHPEPVVL
ncbi:hypothetical protein O6H91_20G014200 [Diphasiastrum complanatum]|uniref:Uncharacterized protein n=1 Tax=Diphasiastrum complanatum TaxID=34168 RepID=A0ACC2AMV2_DIPCM|nr:hypothetical protein O6H91_20G014200 [Diphasiastrum complanatum]